MVDRIDAKEWLLTCDALANLRSAEEDIRGPGDGERLFILVGALDEACRAASMFEARVEVLERALVDIAADGKLTPDGAILRARAALAGKGETMIPEELRLAMDEWERSGKVPDLYAFASAWQADIKDARVYEKMANHNADVIDAKQARIEALDSNAGLLASLLREAWLFKGYGYGPLAHNHEAIRMVLNTRTTLAGKEAVLRNGPAWSPPIVNPGFDTDVGGADVFKSWAEETGAVGVEATWRPVRFSQSMTCPLCHETFEIIATANVRGAAWVDDLSAVVPSAAIAEDEPKRLLPWDEYVKKVRAAVAGKERDNDGDT